MTVIITKLVSSGVYIVSDSVGRNYRVYSSAKYKIGDSVSVINNQIVGYSGVKSSVKIFEV